MKNSHKIGIAGLFSALVLSGCSDLQSAIGQKKDAPDEFAVVSHAPLSLPPNYQLRPPRPGEARPQEKSVKKEAQSIVLGANSPAASVQTGPTTTGINAMRRDLKVDDAMPGIRKIVNEETANYKYEDEYLIDVLLFWRDKPEPGVVVDATEESRRLRENSALGKPMNTGQTPVIERKRDSLFN